MANTSEPVAATTATQPTPTEVAPTEATPAPAPITTQPPTATTTADAPQPAVVPTVPTETPAPAAPEKTLDKPEPQNPLTERFTTQEWTALKEFRVRKYIYALTDSLNQNPYRHHYRLSFLKYSQEHFQTIPRQKKHPSSSGASRLTLPIPATPKLASS